MSDTLKTVACSGAKDCKNVFSTTDELSEKFVYTCKLHPRKKQTVVPAFQEFAHDERLDKKEKKEDYERRENAELMVGEPLDPRKKCEHGVYAPDGDRRYCSICTPIEVTGQLLHMKKLRVDLGEGSKFKVGTFKNPSEQIDQAIGVVTFFQFLKKKPAWLRDVHFGIVDDLTGLTNQLKG